MAVYYFSGYENYLKKKELNKITDKIDCPELNVASFHEAGAELMDFLSSYPFVGGKKVCILKFFPEEKDVYEALKELPGCIDVYIVPDSTPDRRKNVVKEILVLAEEKEFKKINDELLFRSISAMLQRFGFSETEVLSLKDVLMNSFSGYRMHAEMDLEEVQKHVKMIAYSGSLTAESIRTFAPDNSEHKAFKISSMLLNLDKNCLRFAKNLLEQGDSAIGLFSLIAYQIRVCYKAMLFKDENYLNLIGIRDYQLYSNFRNYDADKYLKVYELLMEGIRRAKNGGRDEAVMLDTLMAALAIIN